MDIAHTGSPNLVAVVAGDRVRVRVQASRVALTGVTGSDGAPSARAVLAAAGDRHGTVMAPAVRVGPTRLHLVEVEPAAVGDQWLGLDDLRLVDEPAGVAVAIRRGVAEFRGEVDPPHRRPTWYRAGWRAQVDGWVDQTLAGAGLSRSGPSEPVAVWALSCVLRVPVGGAGAVFVKATCDWFRAEPGITELLARRAPDVVPEVLGTDRDRAWMLMRPLPGDDGETPPTAGPAAAAALARIQVVMLDHLDELRAAGAPDRRLAQTAAGITAVVEDESALADLTADERRTTRHMRHWLLDQLTALAGCGMPFALGHGDLHLGNVAYADGRVVLYDWTDAAVTFPVLDADLLATSSRDQAPAVREAYVAGWRPAVAESSVREALRLAGLVNPAYQAVSFFGIARAVEDRARADNAGVVVRMLRRLNQLYAERAGWHRGHQ